jgi:uncharacterized protein YfaS (alpha-2-macroglobulin family)
MRSLALAAAIAAVVGLYASAFSAEVPAGVLRGQVVAADTGQALVGLNVLVRPASPRDGSDVRRATTGRDGGFLIRALPAGAYQVETATSAYRDRPLPAAVREGETASVSVRLEPGDPYLNLYIHQHAFLPEDEPRLALNGFRQGEDLHLRVMAIDGLALLREQGSHLRQLLAPVSTSGRRGTTAALGGGLRGRGPQAGALLRTVREWTHHVKKRDAEGVFYDELTTGRLPAGVYLVQARGPASGRPASGHPASQALGWLMVTDLALVTKSVRASESSPPRLLTFSADLRTGRPVPGVRMTLYGGDARLTQVVTDSRGLADLSLDRDLSDPVAIVARRGESIALTQVDAFEHGDQERYRVFSYTDRPVYRPGHRVRFKGVVRKLKTSGYDLPAPQSVDVEARDEEDATVYRARLAMTPRGSFAGEFTLPAEALSGGYTLNVHLDDQEYSDGFVVASYRKPEWRVEVQFAKSRYTRGERVPATVRAQYYFGAPVVRARVDYTVYRSRYWAWGHDDSDDTSDEEPDGYYGDVVTSGETRTGADGTASFEFETAPPEGDDASAPYEYHVEAEVTDLSDRSASGSGSVRVSPGELVLETRPTRSVASPGERVPVLVRARDLDGNPAAGVSLTATTILQVWGGRRGPRAGPVERNLGSQSVRTDARGEASLLVALPETGLAMVKVSARDRRGNPIAASADLWVSTAEGGDFASNYPALAVMPDRKLYHTGDVAQVLLNSDRPGATALVAVEAEQIFEYRLVPLRRKSTVVRLPVRAGYAPNVYVTACLVREREFVSSQARLNVDMSAQRLKVSIRSDREVYRPGDMATFRVRTVDARGRPVRSEVSFGLVDEAVYAIREEPKRGLWEAFHPRRANEVSTQFSYPEIYLGDAQKDAAETALRKDFPDTAFWEPFLLTGDSGEAAVRVRMPDSLTRWRATAVAHTPGTEIGKGTASVRVMRDLTLRLQAPRALTEGDQLSLSAVAHNYTASPLEAVIELKASGLVIRNPARQRIMLRPGEADKVAWDVTAPGPGGHPGRAVLRATVTAGGPHGPLADGMQITVPIRPFVRQSVLFRAGSVSQAPAREEFTLDPASAGGALEVRLSPTLAGTLLGSLDYLVSYPYGCTEQTMSSFLPAVLVLRTLKELGLERRGAPWALERRLPAVTQAGLLRLYRFQHGPQAGTPGGWGWWEYDDTDPWMTAYVLLGLQLARESGVAVHDQVYRSALNAARELATGEKLGLDDAQFLAYVLARGKASGEARRLLRRFAGQEARLQARSLGYRALALAALGGAEDRRQAAAVMDRLWAGARRGPEGTHGLVHWSESRATATHGVPEDAETTAVALRASLALRSHASDQAWVVRWLLLQRSGNRWASTRDTAWILFALVDYLKATGELRPDYRLAVLLNGREVHAETLRPADALREETRLRLPLRELRPANRLEIRKSGPGTVYYSLQLTQEIRAPAFAPESSIPGLSIQREYFRLETQRGPTGREGGLALPEKRPTGAFRVGDRILVRLRIRAGPAGAPPLDHLMIEEPLPAGWEVQDRGEIPLEDWNYWWSHVDVRDDRILFFARRLGPEGTRREHVIEYYARAEMAGRLRVLPAALSHMYAPGSRAATGDARVEVAP